MKYIIAMITVLVLLGCNATSVPGNGYTDQDDQFFHDVMRDVKAFDEIIANPADAAELQKVTTWRNDSIKLACDLATVADVTKAPDDVKQWLADNPCQVAK